MESLLNQNPDYDVFYLQSTYLGDYRSRRLAKSELVINQESTCGLNTSIDFIQWFSNGRNVLPVDPRLTVSGHRYPNYQREHNHGQDLNHFPMNTLCQSTLSESHIPLLFSVGNLYSHPLGVCCGIIPNSRKSLDVHLSIRFLAKTSWIALQ